MTALALGDGVLAHGGGAPEAAMVGLPVLVLAVFVVLERRARRREAEQEPTHGADEHESGDA
jgi:membrane protein implicated in regulation of membrane protease activity